MACLWALYAHRELTCSCPALVQSNPQDGVHRIIQTHDLGEFRGFHEGTFPHFYKKNFMLHFYSIILILSVFRITLTNDEVQFSKYILGDKMHTKCPKSSYRIYIVTYYIK